MDSPRPGQKLEDSFTFTLANLQGWLLADELWTSLPDQLRTELKKVQHAGAAATTSSDRVQKYLEDMADDLPVDAKLHKGLQTLSLDLTATGNKRLQDDKNDSPIDEITSGEMSTEDRPGSAIRKALDEPLGDFEALPSPKYGTIGDANSIFHYGLATPPITPPEANTESSTPGLVSPDFSPMVLPHGARPSSAGTPVDAPYALESAVASPLMSAASRSRSRTRSMSLGIQLEGQERFLVPELSHLRTEILPHLRHSVRKVDVAFVEAKLAGTISTSHVEAFEPWWKSTKAKINRLDNETKTIADDINLPPTGMGWQILNKSVAAL